MISLDIRKAFDRMWREGLYYKLIGKMEMTYWRAIVNYYDVSEAMVRVDGVNSYKFKTIQGVKQGGILSPYLFNFFIDDLINSCDIANVGAKVAGENLSTASYCDDLIIKSSNQRC